MGSKRIQDGTDPLIAEAEAVMWVIAFIRELGLQLVVVESDSLVLITKLRRRTEDNGLIGVFIRRILDMIGGAGVVNWSFVKRSGNAAAHLLAGLRPSVCC